MPYTPQPPLVLPDGPSAAGVSSRQFSYPLRTGSRGSGGSADRERAAAKQPARNVPPLDPNTVREVLGPEPAPADLDALRHELVCALWDLRERQAGRAPWGGLLLIRGRPLADWLPLQVIARILGGGDPLEMGRGVEAHQ